MNISKTSGFTLLELSIVIVIIGLIVAGISAGQSLVRQAGLRQISVEFDKLATAYNAFNMQYGYPPGDLAGSNYWSSALDGDQDKDIENASEQFQVWLHLSLAGVVEGTFTGTGNTVSNFVPGTNVYAGPLSGSAYHINYETAIHEKNGMNFSGSDNNRSATPALTPAEAASIDTKIDVGAVTTGQIIGLDSRNGAGTWLSGQCTTPATRPTFPSGTATYNISSTDSLCQLRKKLLF